MKLDKEFFTAMEPMLPLALAYLTSDDKDKQRIIKLGELCEEHNVRFSSFMAIAQKLSEWEATH